MTERANPFGGLTDFVPTPAKPKTDQAMIDQVAEKHGFPSRQPAKETQAAPVAVTAVQPEKEKLRQKVFRITAGQDRELTKRLADLDMTMQDIVLEGINSFLASKGLPPI